LKSLLAMVAASVALIGGVQVLAPVPAAAMDGQDETSPCTEETDWYYDDVGEDCPGEGGNGGGGGASDGGDPAGGGTSTGGDDHYYDETGDPCADYGECWDAWGGTDDERSQQDELDRKREREELERDFKEDHVRVAEEILERIKTERKALLGIQNEITARCNALLHKPDWIPGTCEHDLDTLKRITVELDKLDREERGPVEGTFEKGRTPRGFSLRVSPTPLAQPMSPTGPSPPSAPAMRAAPSRSRSVGVRSNGASIRPLPLAPANGPGKKHKRRGRRAHKPS
jgi:hypothetical protein